MIYNHCGICKKSLNKYFCESCRKNISDKCYEKCKNKKHSFKNLNEMKESDSNIIKKIKNFLNTNIIPLKEVSENSLKGYFVSFEKEENDEDILLIIGIISKDYNNYFHYENIKRISEYIQNIVNKKCSGDKYNGFGKLIADNGYYFIGQFKDNIINGKGNVYDQNGNLMYEGDFINGVREGNGKLIVDNGYYNIGQFKDNIIIEKEVT